MNAERARNIAQGIAEGIANTMRRVDEGMDAREYDATFRRAYDQIYGSVYRQLYRSERIVAMLGQDRIPEYDAEARVPGFSVVIRELNHDFVMQLGESVGQRLDEGTIVVPRGFAGYGEQLAEAERYQHSLAARGVHGQLIVLLPHIAWDERVALHIP